MKTLSGFFTNWKTSICGIAIGALQMVENGTGWKSIAVSIGISLLGLVAKDSTTHSTQTEVNASTDANR